LNCRPGVLLASSLFPDPFLSLLLRRCPLLRAQAATTKPVTTRRLERVTAAPATDPSRHTNPTRARPASREQRSPQLAHPDHHPPPYSLGKNADSVHGFH